MTRARRTIALALTAVILLAGPAAVLAQRFGFRGGEPIQPNTPYDGRFTFVRVRYGPVTTYASQRLPWSHDYPTGEQKFMKILNEVSYLAPHIEETNILGLDDAELFKYPVAYMAEPGLWYVSETEAAGLRAYLHKGGFIIFDDFSEGRGGWANFEAAFRQAIPDAVFVDLDPSHPIFHSFFEIDSFDIVPQAYDYGRPVFRAVFEDNDPQKRMIAMINYNTDISEFWEWSGTGYRPISETNEAFKLGVNYVIYGMTH